MNGSSPDWVRIVRFVRDSLGWPVEAQSEVTGISSTTLYEWCRAGRVPSISSWASYMRWILTLSCVRNYSSDGSPWAVPGERLSHRHNIYLLSAPKNWLILFFYDGDLVGIEEGPFLAGDSLDHLYQELAELTELRALEIEDERAACA